MSMEEPRAIGSVRAHRGDDFGPASRQSSQTRKRRILIVPFAIGSLVFCLFQYVYSDHGFETATAKAKQSGTGQGVYPPITVSPDQRISGHIRSLPLEEVLLMMSGKNLFAIKGALPLGETVSATLIDASLETALRKLLRGYNYVIVKQEAGTIPLLIVMGKAARSNSIVPRLKRTFARPRGNRAPEPRNRYLPPAAMNHPTQAISPAPTNAFSTHQVPASRQTAGSGQPGRQGGKADFPESKNRSPGEVRSSASAGNQPSAQTGFPSTPGNTGVKF